MDIQKIVAAQREYFASGVTLPPPVRRQILCKLRTAIQTHESEIQQALHQDLNKCGFESYMAEIGMVLDELTYAIHHLVRWAKAQFVPTPLAQFPSRSAILREPYGVTLIMAPWNYPFLLSMDPLIGAVAAGNCVVLKPSAYAPATSAIMAKLIAEVFPPQWVTTVEGGREENTQLLEQRFDFIFFTGSAAVGRMVMEKAARWPAPVILELGGKSPVIVGETANIPLTAKRIAFGKLLNAGQTCVAPDYILVQRSVRDQLVQELKKQFAAMLGSDPLNNPDYVRIVNQKHFDRLLGLLEGEDILYGGASRPGDSSGWIEPTLIADTLQGRSKPMQEEIFGPILPIIPFDTLNEAIHFVNQREKPLALYLFTQCRAARHAVIAHCSFGGGCINDTVIHLASHHMGFGGVGASGLGSYHGKRSFDAFSHEKSIVRKFCWLDLPMRYQPYTRTHEKFVRFFLH